MQVFLTSKPLSQETGGIRGHIEMEMVDTELGEWASFRLVKDLFIFYQEGKCIRVLNSYELNAKA